MGNPILVNPDWDTVFYLMAQINHKCGVSTDHQIIVFHGRQINTSAQLKSKLSDIFGVPAGSKEFHVVVELCFDPRKVPGILFLLPWCKERQQFDLGARAGPGWWKHAVRRYGHVVVGPRAQFDLTRIS